LTTVIILASVNHVHTARSVFQSETSTSVHAYTANKLATVWPVRTLLFLRTDT